MVVVVVVVVVLFNLRDVIRIPGYLYCQFCSPLTQTLVNGCKLGKPSYLADMTAGCSRKDVR